MANKFVKSFNFGGEDNYFPLPFVGAEQNGMVLKVVGGEWEVASLGPLEPGLYGVNNVLLASWDELIDTYGMDVSATYTNDDFMTNTSSPHYILFNYDEFSTATKLVIDDSVTSIGDHAFRSCIRLTDVVIPEGVTSIGDSAFAVCYNLTSVVIPSTVTSIGDSAFYGCTALTSIIIPEGISYLASMVFRSCIRLTDVVIPEGVTSIGYYLGGHTFYDCTGLTSIVIPSTVTRIYGSVFYGCTALTDVYYTGTEEEWAAITINSGNDVLSAATIHYNYVV